MKILAIETSCDETAVAVVEARGDTTRAEFSVLGNALFSQIEMHREYGGVYPTIAKREHARNLVPITRAALSEAGMITDTKNELLNETQAQVSEILSREPELTEDLLSFIEEIEVPNIDAIAVTSGPGLEPALWVGISFAHALSVAWDKPLIPVNHMEGHILSSLVTDGVIEHVELPLLALLISGGHTELVVMKEWLLYELVGQTRDDAVGEAFDKVARMMELPYPGGPEISKLAEIARKEDVDELTSLPRPMQDVPTCDFSFAGLKTAVLYALKEVELNEENKKGIALAFENAAADVLRMKTVRALDETGAKTLVLGGGVSANQHIRRVFEEIIATEYPHVSLRIPAIELTTDNAIMIALAGFYRAQKGNYSTNISADGNLSLT